ncbi:biotin--[acetyl-CoA-carboxylase] ligase [Granulicoccus phenolivorans]|uniref:biotin--[acetyl-CoA-carboxylase] ligase n=1 Tax=Granulicoccus phenolivorans TaxID=266854 RepID=UPI000420B9E9|nr:biotin--[acetyl-CoA-carboxylase] ligase [Granulicoccus phenolivorans]
MTARTALTEHALAAAGGGLWSKIEVLPEIGSTNLELAARARAGTAGPGTVLVTDHQTAGRGRFDRVWVTPPGAALAMSVLVRPEADFPRWTWLPLLSGLAVADAVAEVSSLAVTLKWPNDVLLDGAKICGMLGEVVTTPDGPMFVMGLGINVALTADQLPVPTATSLALHGAQVSPADLAVAVLRHWETHYLQWARHDPALDRAYAARCGTIGQQVRVQLTETEQVHGTGVGVDESGQLLVRIRETGDVRAYAAGDVFHLRPAG